MSEPIPPEALYEFTKPEGVTLSPDGERLAYLATEYDGVADEKVTSLFVVPTNGSREPYRLTRASDASNPAWSPDGTKLGFLAARETDPERSIGRPEADRDGDEGEAKGEKAESGADEEQKPQLWVFDMERGGDARQVTDREEGVSGFDWGPEGDQVVVASRDPTEEQREQLDQREEGGPIEIERLQHKLEGVGWTDEVETYLFVVDLETHEERRLDDAYMGGGARTETGGMQPAWSPDGEQIAFLSNRADRPDDTARVDLYVISPEGGETERLTDGTLSAMEPKWSPDGKRIAFIGRSHDNWYLPHEVRVADPEAGETRSVSESLDRTVSWFGRPRWLDESTLLAGIADEGHVGLVRLDAQTDDPEPLDWPARDRSLVLSDVQDGTVVASVSTPGEGHDFYAFPADALADPDSERRRLTDLNGDLLEKYAFPTAERVTFDNGEGDEVEAICYLPESVDPAAPEPHPLIVNPHGGPMSYDVPEFGFEEAFWTSRGYVVCQPNYRGSTSYGREFAEALMGKWGTKEIADVLAGVDHLVEEGWADPNRLFVTGFSYGGISTGFLLTQDDRFAAGAAEHGIYDLRSAYGTDDSHIWFADEFGLPWEVPEAYDAGSSITDIGGIDTPLLITAGEKDWRCPPTQSEQLYVRVKKQGVPAKLVVYPDEGHAVSDPDRAVHRFEELSGWFRRFDPGRG